MRISGGALVAFASVLTLVVGTHNGFAQERRIPGMGCESRFAQMDSNKDGKVTLQEFNAVPHPEGKAEMIFRLKDTNRDGALTKKEFCAGKAKKKTKEKEKEKEPPTSP